MGENPRAVQIQQMGKNLMIVRTQWMGINLRVEITRSHTPTSHGARGCKRSARTNQNEERSGSGNIFKVDWARG